MATDNKNTSTPELGNSDDGIKIRAKNRLKAATDNVRGMLKEVLKPVKTYIVVTGIGIALFFAIIVLLTAALWYLKENHTKQDTENPTNVPGTVKNVMTATVSKDPNTGEITFVYNEKKPQANLPTNLGNTSANASTNSTTVNSLDNFLFIGDSRYEGLDTSSLGSNIKNVGVTSATIAEWKAVAENNGKGTVQGKTIDITGTYSGISIQLGVNSLVSGNIDSVVDEMKALISGLQKIHPNTPIFVNSCLQVNPKENYPNWEASVVKGYINDFNTKVKATCNSTNNVYYIDVNHSLNNNEGYLKDEYTGDGLHCNSAGQIEFLKNIKNAITGSGAGGTTVATVDSIIADMTLEEKIYQLLMVQNVVSDGNNFSNVKYGGYIVGSTSNYNNNLGKIGSNYKIAPFIATDDEGGEVTRAASQYKTNARTYGDNKSYTKLSNDETEKSNYLLGLGINLNLGPVTDVISQGALYNRSFSGDTAVVKECIKTIIEARKKSNLNGVSISSSLKHYPGYPDTSVNTDFGVAQSDRTMDAINKNIDVFKEGANSGAQSIMVSNVIYTNYDKDNPASLSPTIIGDLRKNFNGVIMTDDIGNAQGVGDRPNRFKEAIIAGNDMILVWEGQASPAYDQIKAAVANGEISEDRIDESVKRILDWKVDVGLLQLDKVTNNGSNNDEADSDFLVMTESVVLSKIKNEDGKEEWCIATDLDARVEAIYESLEENSSDSLTYFKNEKEAKEALKLWIMAEYSSQYLNLSENPENYTHKYDADYIQGSVKVKRYSVDDKGNEISKYITYKDPVEFEQLKSKYRANGDMAVFDYFTINSEDDLVVAQYRIEDQKCSWTGETDPNGELDPTYTNYIIDDARLNYRDLVREYSMPFNLLWAMVVYGEDVSFANELAKLAIDSEIVIGIRDNVTTTVTTTVDKYLKEEKLEKFILLSASTLNLPMNRELSDNRWFYEYNIKPSGGNKISQGGAPEDYLENGNKTALEGINPNKYYEKTTVKTDTSNYISKEVEYIDSWFAKYEMTYTSENTTKTEGPKTVEEKNTSYESFEKTEIDETNNPKKYIDQDDDAKTMYSDLKYRIEGFDSRKILYNAIDNDIYMYLYANSPIYLSIMWNNGQVVYDVIDGNPNDYSSLTQEEVEAIAPAYADKVDEVKQKCNDIYDYLLNYYNAAERQRIINENIAATRIRITKEWFRRTVNRTITTDVVTNTKKFNKVKTEIIEKVDKEVKSGETENFISILCKDEHKKAYGGFTGSLSEWFFSALEKNEDTEGYIDLIKYLLYKATDKDFGVTEYDMSTAKFKIKKSGMKNTGVLAGNTVEAKVWYAMKNAGFSDMQIAAAMGNFAHEGAYKTNNIENAAEYKFGNDISFTEGVNNGSISEYTFVNETYINSKGENSIYGYGLAQWSAAGRKQGLYSYAKDKGVGIDDVTMQIEYLIGELGYGPAYEKDFAKIWLTKDKTTTYAGYHSAKDWYDATSDELDEGLLREITLDFCYTFEIPEKSIDSENSRVRSALAYYNQFHGKTLVGGTGGIYEPKASAEDGIYGYFKSDSGRVFTVYNQCAIPGYDWLHYCNKAAAASILSAYRKQGQSDWDIAYEMNDPLSPLADVSDTESKFREYGLKASSIKGFDRNKMESTLKSGGYVAIHIIGNGIDRIGKSNFKYTNGSSMHWVAILGYRVENGEEQIMISNSGWYHMSGWVPIDDFADFDGLIDNSWYITE